MALADVWAGVHVHGGAGMEVRVSGSRWGLGAGVKIRRAGQSWVSGHVGEGCPAPGSARKRAAHGDARIRSLAHKMVGHLPDCPLEDTSGGFWASGARPGERVGQRAAAKVAEKVGDGGSDLLGLARASGDGPGRASVGVGRVVSAQRVKS